MRFERLVWLAALTTALSGCADCGGSGDADIDADGDADADADADADTDADTDPPACTSEFDCLAHSPNVACCNNVCVNPLNHPQHCGSCSNNCISSQKGNVCTLGQCSCGIILGGCAGHPTECCKYVFFTYVCDNC